MLKRVFSAVTYDSEAVTAIVAKALKTMEPWAVDEAARAMIARIDYEFLQGCDITLVPVPDHKGSCLANKTLCEKLRYYLWQDPKIKGKHVVTVKACLERTEPLPMPVRKLRKRMEVLPEMHNIIRRRDIMVTGAVLVVDNVITTGTTLAACSDVLPDCSGWVYAEAKP